MAIFWRVLYHACMGCVLRFDPKNTHCWISRAMARVLLHYVLQPETIWVIRFLDFQTWKKVLIKNSNQVISRRNERVKWVFLLLPPLRLQKLFDISRKLLPFQIPKVDWHLIEHKFDFFVPYNLWPSKTKFQKILIYFWLNFIKLISINFHQINLHVK